MAKQSGEQSGKAGQSEQPRKRGRPPKQPAVTYEENRQDLELRVAALKEAALLFAGTVSVTDLPVKVGEMFPALRITEGRNRIEKPNNIPLDPGFAAVHLVLRGVDPAELQRRQEEVLVRWAAERALQESGVAPDAEVEPQAESSEAAPDVKQPGDHEG